MMTVDPNGVEPMDTSESIGSGEMMMDITPTTTTNSILRRTPNVRKAPAMRSMSSALTDATASMKICESPSPRDGRAGRIVVSPMAMADQQQEQQHQPVNHPTPQRTMSTTMNSIINISQNINVLHPPEEAPLRRTLSARTAPRTTGIMEPHPAFARQQPQQQQQQQQLRQQQQQPQRSMSTNTALQDVAELAASTTLALVSNRLTLVMASSAANAQNLKKSHSMPVHAVSPGSTPMPVQGGSMMIPASRSAAPIGSLQCTTSNNTPMIQASPKPMADSNTPTFLLQKAGSTTSNILTSSPSHLTSSPTHSPNANNVTSPTSVSGGYLSVPTAPPTSTQTSFTNMNMSYTSSPQARTPSPISSTSSPSPESPLSSPPREMNRGGGASPRPLLLGVANAGIQKRHTVHGQGVRGVGVGPQRTKSYLMAGGQQQTEVGQQEGSGSGVVVPTITITALQDAGSGAEMSGVVETQPQTTHQQPTPSQPQPILASTPTTPSAAATTAAGGGPSYALPPHYKQYYHPRLTHLALLSLTHLKIPVPVVLLSLYYVHRLCALRSLPESLANPVRLLLVSLMLADTVLVDHPASRKSWEWVGRRVGVLGPRVGSVMGSVSGEKPKEAEASASAAAAVGSAAEKVDMKGEEESEEGKGKRQDSGYSSIQEGEKAAATTQSSASSESSLSASPMEICSNNAPTSSSEQQQQPAAPPQQEQQKLQLQTPLRANSISGGAKEVPLPDLKMAALKALDFSIHVSGDLFVKWMEYIKKLPHMSLTAAQVGQGAQAVVASLKTGGGGAGGMPMSVKSVGPGVQ
ncbi:hypothetical protein HDV05_003318 [Chytridiales sp. JEL 0842]|nr:hypothetical protein HDV05_003318 [Chytridiales sp. JEL 0842]